MILKIQKIVHSFLFIIIFSGIILIYQEKEASSKGYQNKFLVKNLEVSAEDKGPSIARQKAVQKARRIAFKKILRRLEIDPNFHEIIPSRKISEMTHSEQIINERIAGNNYSANFNIKFSQNFVENTLLDNNIVSGVEKQEKYLIIPLEKTNKCRWKILRHDQRN